MSALLVAIALAVSAAAGAEEPAAGAAPADAAPSELPAATAGTQPDGPGDAPPPAPTWKASVLVAGGWEAAVLQDVRFSGPAGTLGLRLSRSAPADELGLRLQVHLVDRLAETPEGLSGVALRIGFLVGMEFGRFGLGVGLDWSRTTVERVHQGELLGQDLAATAAATADVWRFDQGALSIEVVGAAAGETRQRSLAFLLAYRTR